VDIVSAVVKQTLTPRPKTHRPSMKPTPIKLHQIARPTCWRRGFRSMRPGRKFLVPKINANTADNDADIDDTAAV